MALSRPVIIPRESPLRALRLTTCVRLRSFRPGAPPRFSRLERDAESDARPIREAAVEQVVAVVHVVDVDLIPVIPIVAPVFRVRVYDVEPVAVVLEPGSPAGHQE